MAFQRNITTTTHAALQTKLAANAADINTIYRITDAVGSTKVIDVIASTVSALYGNAENLTDSTFGVYDISANTFVVSGDGTFVKKSGDNMTGALLLAQSTSIASAATVDLATATGNIVPITGNTGPITSLGTVASGEFTLIFASTPTLTHNATSLILPTGANIVVQAGDVAQFVSLGSGNWKCTGYLRASGSPLVGAASSLAATLAVGNTTGGTDIEVSTGDKIVFDTTEIEDVGVLQIMGLGLVVNNAESGNTSSVSVGTIKIETTLNVTNGPDIDHTESFLIGLGDGSAGIQLTTSDGVDTQDIVLKPDGFTAPLNYQPGQTFTQPYEVVNKEYVDGRPIPSYTTISKADFLALAGANGLAPNGSYRVTSAYTFDFYGAKDIIVVADSVNTVQSTGWVVFADYFVPYQVDASLSNPGVFFDCVQAMALDPDAVLGYTGAGFNWKFNVGLQFFILATDGYYYQAQIQGGDNGAFILDNVKALDGANLGDFGTYIPQTAPAAADDYFIPAPNLRQLRLELSSAEIGSATSIDIPGLDGTTDYFWDATDVRIANTFATTPYTNTLYIQSQGAADPQWSDGGVLQAVSSQFKGMTDLKSAPAADDVFADGGKLRVTKSGADVGGGDGTVVLFITAQLVKITA